MPASYDVVFSSFVLEHVEGAEDMLDRLVPAIRPGGLLLLLHIPDRDSVYGFVIRHSPHWLRVQYKRRILGAKQAGTPGCEPFPPVYDRIVSWRGITGYCDSRGLEIVDAYSSNFYLHSSAVRRDRRPRTAVGGKLHPRPAGRWPAAFQHRLPPAPARLPPALTQCPFPA
jgi:hypothetical protein